MVWYLGDLVVLEASSRAFNASHRFYGSVGMRAVFAIVFLLIVFHGLDGLRVTILDMAPRLTRGDAWLRMLVSFVTFAVWVPSALVLLWPAVRDWFAR